MTVMGGGGQGYGQPQVHHLHQGRQGQQQQDAGFLRVAMTTPLPPSPGVVGGPGGFPGRQ